MEEALPGASVTGYEKLVGDLSLPDPGDRHVLAAAIQAEAGFIVTFNTSDFPSEELAPHEVQAVDPDPFTSSLLNRTEERLVEVARAHRASLTNPEKTPEEYLHLLKKSRLEETAGRLAEHEDRI